MFFLRGKVVFLSVALAWTSVGYGEKPPVTSLNTPIYHTPPATEPRKSIFENIWGTLSRDNRRFIPVDLKDPQSLYGTIRLLEPLSKGQTELGEYTAMNILRRGWEEYEINNALIILRSIAAATITDWPSMMNAHVIKSFVNEFTDMNDVNSKIQNAFIQSQLPITGDIQRSVQLALFSFKLLDLYKKIGLQPEKDALINMNLAVADLVGELNLSSLTNAQRAAVENIVFDELMRSDRELMEQFWTIVSDPDWADELKAQIKVMRARGDQLSRKQLRSLKATLPLLLTETVEQKCEAMFL